MSVRTGAFERRGLPVVANRATVCGAFVNLGGADTSELTAMIIDVHVHLVGMNPENGCWVSPDMTDGLIYYLFTWELGLGGVERERVDEAYRDQLVVWAEESDVDGVGILAFDAVYDDAGYYDHRRTKYYVSNDACFAACEYSEKLFPIASVNPMRRDARAELERVAEKGAVALKLLPNSQGIDPADPCFRSFWRRAAELDLPLISHTSFEHTVPAIDQSFGKPRKLIPALEEGLTVIAAHCAGSGVAHPFEEDFDTWLAMLDEYPNLYGDISAMASVSRFPYIHRVLESDLARQRVVLGSDIPVPISPMVFSPQLGWSKARRLAQISNPIQQNLEVFRALGVDDGVLERGAELLRLPEEFDE